MVIAIGLGYFQKKQIRKELKHQIIAGIDKSELVEFTFSTQEAANLSWEHAKEFEYNGYMYDVVERLDKGDTIVMWCWKDDQETQLNQKLNSLMAMVLSNQKPEDNNTHQILDIIKKIIPEQAPSYCISNAKKEENTVPYTLQLISRNVNPNLPPPQV